MINKPFFSINTETLEDAYGRFSIEPLAQGFGNTIGNSLRRVLLMFLPGTAISKVKIAGVKHQFSTMEGLREDIVEFILNLKKVHFHLDGEEEVKATLTKSGPGEIHASDIKLPAGVSIANPDEYLASLSNRNTKLDIELWIEKGVGYKPAEERSVSEIGVIPVDSLFSPVHRVKYHVEETRVGRATNYDKLVLEIWTNGAINPKDAIMQSAEILVAYFTHIIHPTDMVKETTVSDNSVSKTVLTTTVDELDLSIRVVNALKKGGYKNLADFQGKGHADLERVRNLGAKSIAQIEKLLHEKGIELA